MPRKSQGWVTFQSSEEELRLLEQYCLRSQRTKTDILRELVRNLDRISPLQQQSPTRKDQKENIRSRETVFPSQDSEIKFVQISARNVLKSRVKRVVMGTINAEVTLEVAPGVELVSVITKTSAERLQLEKGKEIYAIVKSNNITLALGPSSF